MDTPFEIFQSIEALGIIIFSLVSTYYGIRVLYIHISLHRKLLMCCWIVLIQTFSQFLFLLAFIFILWQLLLRGTNLVDPRGFGALFIRPIVLINNVIIGVYLKIRFINEKNKKLMGEETHG